MIINAEHYLELHPEIKAAYHANGNEDWVIYQTTLNG